MKFKGNFLKILAKTSFLLSISLVTFSSLIYLYSQRGLLIRYLYPQYRADENIDESNSDRLTAKKIMNGGYILHFRHAERDKWIDVQMYDSLESDLHSNGENQSRYAEKDYFKNAVCLNERGLIQAKAIGEHLKNIQLPIGNVISSPSCRSRQTADIAFGGYNKLLRDLVHVGPYSEKKEQRTNKLIDLYSNLPIFEGKNTIVSSHNGVIHSEMFENNNDPNLSLEEGGFYVISNKGGKLLLEHEYNNFNNFIKLFYER
tara:strand:- start:45 stop:821 length:777 start_codon:yes stop_codon:yes gene_type:complete